MFKFRTKTKTQSLAHRVNMYYTYFPMESGRQIQFRRNIRTMITK